MGINIEIGTDSITSYKRLAYTPWHAIAELVDNSTQSYFDNRDVLDVANKKYPRPLVVKVDYDIDNEILRVEDNAMGMSYSELKRALKVAKPPVNTSGRSKYGMGLKTAASWIGNLWMVKTKKLGETIEHSITVDVENIVAGNNDLHHKKRTGIPKNKHYTIIEIRKHNRKFKGQTLGKIERYLSSMYREDFRNKVMSLYWRDKELFWKELDDKLLKDHDGNPYSQEFNFVIEEDGIIRTARGWVGVLEEGSRSNAGFSILHSGRVVRGWPDSWRPETLYGQQQGSNDLVNQRLVGEIHLDDFDVSHTKDDILWLGEQEDLVQNKLLEAANHYKEVAKTYRKTRNDKRGPSDMDTRAAINSLKSELESNEIKNILLTNPMLTKNLVESVVKSVKAYVLATYKETIVVEIIKGLTVRVYVESAMSTTEPYLTVDSAKAKEVIIIVNAAHPHWLQLDNALSVLNYLRHCIYDGVAEWQAKKYVDKKVDPDTIKILKDRLLRLPLDIENSQPANDE